MVYSQYVHFANLNEIIATIPQADRDENGQWLDRLLDRYATATIEPVLNDLFGPTESRSMYYPYQSQITPVDRGSLVIVDGKTVKERMQEAYLALRARNPNMMQFSDWYRNNLEVMSAKIVTAGLMAGKIAEVYIPGSDGTLPARPNRLQKSGYAPDASTPDIQAAWTRFFRGFGFTTEANPNEARELEDAKERLRAYHHLAQTYSASPMSPVIVDMFFARYMQENGLADYNALIDQISAASGALPSRTMMATDCILMMAVLGWRIQGIPDLSKWEGPKSLAAKVYIAISKLPADKREPWFGSMRFHGQQAILDQIDEIVKNTNWNDSQQRKAMLPVLYGASCALLESYFAMIEASPLLSGGYSDAANETVRRTAGAQGRELTAQELITDTNALKKQTLQRSFDVYNFFDALYQGDLARAFLASPLHTIAQTYTEQFTALAREQWMLQQQAEQARTLQADVQADETIPFQDTVPDFALIISLHGAARSNEQEIRQRSGQIMEQQRTRERSPNEILSGSLDRAVLFRQDLSGIVIPDPPAPVHVPVF